MKKAFLIAQLYHSRDSRNNGKRWDFSQFEVHRSSYGGNWLLEPRVAGQGMSVAIIDTGLCFENSSFTIEPKDQSLVAFDKAAIGDLLAANVRMQRP